MKWKGILQLLFLNNVKSDFYIFTSIKWISFKKIPISQKGYIFFENILKAIRAIGTIEEIFGFHIMPLIISKSNTVRFGPGEAILFLQESYKTRGNCIIMHKYRKNSCISCT